MARECSTRGQKWGDSVGKRTEQDYFKDLSVDERKIIKRILKNRLEGCGLDDPLESR
jgi:hypothetical protein